MVDDPEDALDPSTVSGGLPGEADKVSHLRVSGKPESIHEDIYKKLGVPMLKNRQRTYVAHRL